MFNAHLIPDSAAWLVLLTAIVSTLATCAAITCGVSRPSRVEFWRVVTGVLAALVIALCFVIEGVCYWHAGGLPR